jgi:hypothetical protein
MGHGPDSHRVSAYRFLEYAHQFATQILFVEKPRRPTNTKRCHNGRLGYCVGERLVRVEPKKADTTYLIFDIINTIFAQRPTFLR